MQPSVYGDVRSVEVTDDDMSIRTLASGLDLLDGLLSYEFLVHHFGPGSKPMNLNSRPAAAKSLWI